MVLIALRWNRVPHRMSCDVFLTAGKQFSAINDYPQEWSGHSQMAGRWIYGNTSLTSGQFLLTCSKSARLYGTINSYRASHKYFVNRKFQFQMVRLKAPAATVNETAASRDNYACNIVSNTSRHIVLRQYCLSLRKFYVCLASD